MPRPRRPVRARALRHSTRGGVSRRRRALTNMTTLGRVQEVPSLTPERVRFIKRIYEYLDANAKWPPENELRRAFAQEIAPHESGERESAFVLHRIPSLSAPRRMDRIIEQIGRSESQSNDNMRRSTTPCDARP